MNTIYKSILTTALVLLLFISWSAGLFILGKRSAPMIDSEIRTDTVILRETIRDTVLLPKVRYIARTDTVFLTIPGDTVLIEVEVPIERKVYETADYRATIEGFRPSLVDMEIYRQTKYVTQTEIRNVSDKKRWGLGIQAGYGYNFDRFCPYIGIGVQYSLFRW